MDTLHPATLAQLRAWADAEELPVSPLERQACLLFDASGRVPAAARARITRWVQALPFPTLAIAATDTPLSRAADLRVGDARDAGGIAEQIRRCPIAASVLVRTLRLTELLPIAEALTVESLAYATLQGGVEYRRWLGMQPRAVAPAAKLEPPVVLTRSGPMLEIELNRPERHNAISVEMRDALNEAFRLVAADRSIRKVRVRGRGKCFSIGGDLAEFGTVPDPATGHAVRMLALPARALLPAAKRYEFHVHGPSIGAGVELAAFAHRVIAAPRASFQMPELSMGLIPGAGGCVSIPRRIGRQRAAALMLSGERLDAGEALRLGLIDAVASPRGDA